MQQYVVAITYPYALITRNTANFRFESVLKRSLLHVVQHLFLFFIYFFAVFMIISGFTKTLNEHIVIREQNGIHNLRYNLSPFKI